MARSPFAAATVLAISASLLRATALEPAELTGVAALVDDEQLNFQRLRANLQWRRTERRSLGRVALVNPHDHHVDSNLARTRVCPPHSHDSMHKVCVCDSGFSCVGSSCDDAARFSPFGKQACEDCRCDALQCKRHRHVCNEGCQRFSRHLRTHNPRLLADHRGTVGLPTLLCIVCTSTDRARLSHAANKSWGQQCDDILFISNKADAELGKVFVAASQEPGGGNGAAPATGVTMRAWRHVRRTYGSKHHWFIVLQDDMYLAVDSLKRYLASLEATAQHIFPTYIGRRLRLRSGLVVNSGRAGYVLNTRAVDVVLDVANKTRADKSGAAPTYNPLVCASGHERADDLSCTHWRYLSNQTLPKAHACADSALPSVVTSSVAVATCLSIAGVLPMDSRDGHRLERFHFIGPDKLYQHPAWTDMDVGKLKHMTAPFQFHGGVSSVSRETITFSHANQDMGSAFQAFAKADCHFSSWAHRASDEFHKKRLRFRSARHFKKTYPK